MFNLNLRKLPSQYGEVSVMYCFYTTIIIWDNCSKYEKDELEKVQIEGARISRGATKLISINNLYKQICWDKLQKRRDDHKLTLFYKMYNNLTPNYLSSLIPQQVETILQNNLRNAQDLLNIGTRTSL